MNAILQEPVVTPEDLLRMPDGNRYELVEGRLVETDMSFWASYIAGELLFLLRDYLRSNRIGWVVPEGTTYQCFPGRPAQVRKPDVSFMLFARYPAELARQQGHCRVRPDLAVEVISPNDLIVDLNLKLLDYLDAAIPLVWVIDPQARIVWVIRQGTIRLLREADDLTGDEILPGLRVPLARLFEDPPEAQAPEGDLP